MKDLMLSTEESDQLCRSVKKYKWRMSKDVVLDGDAVLGPEVKFIGTNGWSYVVSMEGTGL